MLKSAGNGTIVISGAFFNEFLWYFLNVIQLAYELLVQSFVRPRLLDVELCWSLLEMLLL